MRLVPLPVVTAPSLAGRRCGVQFAWFSGSGLQSIPHSFSSPFVWVLTAFLLLSHHFLFLCVDAACALITLFILQLSFGHLAGGIGHQQPKKPPASPASSSWADPEPLISSLPDLLGAGIRGGGGSPPVNLLRNPSFEDLVNLGADGLLFRHWLGYPEYSWSPLAHTGPRALSFRPAKSMKGKGTSQTVCTAGRPFTHFLLSLWVNLPTSGSPGSSASPLKNDRFPP